MGRAMERAAKNVSGGWGREDRSRGGETRLVHDIRNMHGASLIIGSLPSAPLKPPPTEQHGGRHNQDSRGARTELRRCVKRGASVRLGCKWGQIGKEEERNA